MKILEGQATDVLPTYIDLGGSCSQKWLNFGSAGIKEADLIVQVLIKSSRVSKRIV